MLNSETADVVVGGGNAGVCAAPAARETGASVELIKAAILSGEFPAGQPLTELTLAEWCGVSRTPIREALLGLEQDGLTDRTDHGLAVRARSPEETRPGRPRPTSSSTRRSGGPAATSRAGSIPVQVALPDDAQPEFWSAEYIGHRPAKRTLAMVKIRPTHFNQELHPLRIRKFKHRPKFILGVTNKHSLPYCSHL